MFFLSAAAKFGATVVTYPLLLVKARLQSAGKHTASDRKYTGTLDAIDRIYKTEGGRSCGLVQRPVMDSDAAFRLCVGASLDLHSLSNRKCIY